MPRGRSSRRSWPKIADETGVTPRAGQAARTTVDGGARRIWRRWSERTLRKKSRSLPRSTCRCRKPTGPPIRPWKPWCTTSTPCIPVPAPRCPSAPSTTVLDTTPEGRMVIRNILLATGGRPGQWRDSHLPHPYLQGQGRHQLQRGRSQLRSVQAGLPGIGQAAVPELLLPGRPLQPAVLQARRLQHRSGLHGLPDPCHGQCLRSHPGSDLRPRQPELYLHQPAPDRHQAPRAMWSASSRSWSARSIWSSSSCWTASRSRLQQKGAQLSLPDGTGRLAGF